MSVHAARRDRLRALVASGVTQNEEKAPIEGVFFHVSEDMNALVEQLFKDLEKQAAAGDEEDDEEPRPAPPPKPPEE